MAHGAEPEHITFNCPFCGQPCKAGELIVHRPNGSSFYAPGIAHNTPMCPTFEQLDPQEFMDACRRKLAQSHN